MAIPENDPDVQDAHESQRAVTSGSLLVSSRNLDAIMGSLLGDSAPNSTAGARARFTADPLNGLDSSRTDLELTHLNLQKQINDLQHHVVIKSEELNTLKGESDDKSKKISELQDSVQLLREKQDLNHLISRVTPAAQQVLLTDACFRDQFRSSEMINAFVVSIDIRRSTELMLKARQPKLFADFVTKVSAQMREIVIRSLGVFDKFTGDGILAFFPEFFSGPDAGFRAVSAAAQCHFVFKKHYRANRHCFSAVLDDAGLGIGIDYGPVQLVEIGQELTVVGNPVVYASRMGGAPPGITLLNQPAFEQVFERYSGYCSFTEDVVEFKHEGRMIAYRVSPNGKPFEPVIPQWLKDAREGTQPAAEPRPCRRRV